MTDIDPSYVLFPNDAPAGTTSAPAEPLLRSPTLTPLWKPTSAVRSIADPAHASAGEDAAKPADDVAAKLFDTERPTDSTDTELFGSIEKLDCLADSARMSGDGDRADMLMEAGTTLVQYARENGTSAADLSEIVGMIHEASATVSEMTADQLSEGKARSLRKLTNAGITETDLDLARGLIRKIGEKIPHLSYQLDATGLGNDVRFITAVVKEAKRRGGK